MYIVLFYPPNMYCLPYKHVLLYPPNMYCLPYKHVLLYPPNMHCFILQIQICTVYPPPNMYCFTHPNMKCFTLWRNIAPDLPGHHDNLRGRQNLSSQLNVRRRERKYLCAKKLQGAPKSCKGAPNKRGDIFCLFCLETVQIL